MKLPAFNLTDLQPKLARAGLLVWLAAGIVVLAATVRALVQPQPVAAESATRPLRATPPPAADSAVRSYVADLGIKTGAEVALVFVGASFCGAHNIPGFPQLIENAKIAVQRQARTGGKQFRAVGVAVDWKPADGYAFLARFGEFDEIMAGSNWIGDGATRYVWRDLPGGAEVPQIIIMERHVDAEAARTIRMSEDRVVRRIQGTKAIEAWVAAGAPI